MKILILVDSLKIGGGSDRVAAILGSALHDEGYEISYLTLMDGNPKYKFKGDYYTLNETDIYSENNLKRLFNLLRYSPKIKRICKDLNIDTIISVGDPANFQAVLSRWLFKNTVHLIITQHMSPEIHLDSKIKVRLIKFFYPMADETVCVSKDMERILNESYGIQNTQTIYNMMDIEKNIKLSMDELPEKYKILFNKNYFNFINVGRLNRQKGQWFLIRSFRKVVNQHENARLFLLGEGTLKKELKDLINKLNLNENVFLMDVQENVFPYLKNSDCFIFTSLWEGLPMTLIEALSMNLSIISTDCKTGPREILCPEIDLKKEINYPYFGEYAILTRNFPNELIFNNINKTPLNESEEVIADLMIRMIEDPDLNKNYSNGLIIAKNFDKDNIIKIWNKLLKKIK
ncbi:MAG: glycosyltransferase [Methanobacterium sp.]|jgi:glycosyltransferase involved in cell wall biosynthesis